MEEIVILGFGGHAKSVADSIRRAGQFSIAGYTDLRPSDSPYEYLGTDDVLERLYASGIRSAVLGMGFMGKSSPRDSLTEMARKIGFRFPAIVDPSAQIARDAVVGEGAFIGKNAVLNAESSAGDFSIVNTGAIVEHESVVGAHSHIAVGAILCGGVRVGCRTLIGAGAVILQGLQVGNGCIVGAGSIVLGNVEDGRKAVGVVRAST